MKREDAKLKFRAEQYYTDDGDLVIPRPYAYDIIDEIFDEHEALLKAKDEEIQKAEQQIGFADIQISELEKDIQKKDKRIYELNKAYEILKDNQ